MIYELVTSLGLALVTGVGFVYVSAKIAREWLGCRRLVAETDPEPPVVHKTIPPFDASQDGHFPHHELSSRVLEPVKHDLTRCAKARDLPEFCRTLERMTPRQHHHYRANQWVLWGHGYGLSTIGEFMYDLTYGDIAYILQNHLGMLPHFHWLLTDHNRCPDPYDGPTTWNYKMTTADRVMEMQAFLSAVEVNPGLNDHQLAIHYAFVSEQMAKVDVIDLFTLD